MSFQPPVVALSELAKVLGVSRVRAMKLIERAEFPPPIAVLSVGRIWSYDAVVEYCERTGRKVHPLPGRMTRGDRSTWHGGDGQRPSPTVSWYHDHHNQAHAVCRMWTTSVLVTRLRLPCAVADRMRPGESCPAHLPVSAARLVRIC